MRSRTFKKQLTLRFYRETGSAPAPAAMDSALAVLEAQAVFDGPEKAVHIRVAEHDGNVYVDLANADWEAVEITPSGWGVVKDPPVRFRRRPGMQALPTPTRGGSLALLEPYLNISDRDGWHMLLAFLVGAMRPKGPFPLIVFQGEQGAAKSTAARVVRSLLDPSRSRCVDFRRMSTTSLSLRTMPGCSPSTTSPGSRTHSPTASAPWPRAVASLPDSFTPMTRRSSSTPTARSPERHRRHRDASRPRRPRRDDQARTNRRYRTDRRRGVLAPLRGGLAGDPGSPLRCRERRVARVRTFASRRRRAWQTSPAG